MMMAGMGKVDRERERKAVFVCGARQGKMQCQASMQARQAARIDWRMKET